MHMGRDARSSFCCDVARGTLRGVGEVPEGAAPRQEAWAQAGGWGRPSPGDPALMEVGPGGVLGADEVVRGRQGVSDPFRILFQYLVGMKKSAPCQPSPGQSLLMLCPRELVHPCPPPPAPLSRPSASQPETSGWSDPFPSLLWCLVSMCSCCLTPACNLVQLFPSAHRCEPRRGCAVPLDSRVWWQRC